MKSRVQMQDPANVARTLSEALPYLQRYAGAIVVVKFGGNAMGDADAELDALCEAALELVSGSGTNPLIMRSMLQPPLSNLHRALSPDDAASGDASQH